MKNLAGEKDCDEYIKIELEKAEIPAILVPRAQNEVPFSIIGKLGDFNFQRAWYYWKVTGDVPLEVAREMYEHPTGKKDIRVVGHCLCPPPDDWATPKIEEIEKFNLMDKNMIEFRELIRKGEITTPLYIHNYHIDSQEGLCLFVNTLKKHNLV